MTRALDVWRRRGRSIAAALCLGLGGCDDGLRHLENEVARLTELSGGTVGVAAIHLETGRRIYRNRTERFPMASSYKVPIAVQLLTRVDRGDLALDSLIDLSPGELYAPYGTSNGLVDLSAPLPVREFLELMLLLSDNSASAAGLRMAGGPAAVTERMRALGITGIRVDRPTIDLIADWRGVRFPPDSQRTPAMLDELYRGMTPAQRDSAHSAFDRDPRDTATPEGMALLLASIWRGEALSDSSRALLLGLMRWSTTGPNRLKGMLTPDTDVSHKTGTLGGTANDVGIITLPHDAGHVVIVVFIKGSTLDLPQRDLAIAHIGRAVHDYFIFHPGRT